MADASLSELDTHVEIARRLGYLADASEISGSVNKVSHLLAALVKSLKSKR
jgi:four helix bundle protein